MIEQAASPKNGLQIERFNVYSHREIKALICGMYRPIFRKDADGLCLILAGSNPSDLENIAPMLCGGLPDTDAPEERLKSLFGEQDRIVLIYVLKELYKLNGCKSGRRKADTSPAKFELLLHCGDFAAFRQIESKKAKKILHQGLNTLKAFGLLDRVERERGAFTAHVSQCAADFLKAKGNYLSLNSRAFSINLKRHPHSVALYFYLSLVQFMQHHGGTGDKSSTAKVSSIIENTALARYKGRNISERILRPLARDLKHLQELELIQWDDADGIRSTEDAIKFRAL